MVPHAASQARSCQSLGLGLVTSQEPPLEELLLELWLPPLLLVSVVMVPQLSPPVTVLLLLLLPQVPDSNPVAWSDGSGAGVELTVLSWLSVAAAASGDTSAWLRRPLMAASQCFGPL